MNCCPVGVQSIAVFIIIVGRIYLIVQVAVKEPSTDTHHLFSLSVHFSELLDAFFLDQQNLGKPCL